MFDGGITRHGVVETADSCSYMIDAGFPTNYIIVIV